MRKTTTKICLECGSKFAGYIDSKNPWCASCYRKQYYRSKLKRRKALTCSKCNTSYIANQNNKAGMCHKCAEQEYQRKYYMEITKPGRQAARRLKLCNV
jgi:hypothetical protein